MFDIYTGVVAIGTKSCDQTVLDTHVECTKQSSGRRLQSMEMVGTDQVVLKCPDGNANAVLDISRANYPIRPVMIAGIYHIIGNRDGTTGFFYIDDNAWIQVYSDVDRFYNSNIRYIYLTQEMTMGFDGGAGFDINTTFFGLNSTSGNFTSYYDMRLAMVRMYSNDDYADSYYAYYDHVLTTTTVMCAIFQQKLLKFTTAKNTEVFKANFNESEFSEYVRASTNGRYT